MQPGDFFSLGVLVTLILALTSLFPIPEGWKGRGLLVAALMLVAWYEFASDAADKRAADLDRREMREDLRSTRADLRRSLREHVKATKQLEAIRQTQAFQNGQLSVALRAAPSDAGIAHGPSLKPPNKYVCVERIAPLLGKGQHALLVEFGALEQPTDGEVVRVDLSGPYAAVAEWMGLPLRTDRQDGISTSRDRREFATPPTSYQVGMQDPSITPTRSLYLLFESDVRLNATGILFLEDLGLLNSAQADEMARKYGPCPRRLPE